MELTPTYIQAILTSLNWETKVSPVIQGATVHIDLMEFSILLWVHKDKLIIESDRHGKFREEYSLEIPKLNSALFCNTIRHSIDTIIKR